MDYTTRQLAQLAGLSSRTLRWYDEIGLLRPDEKTLTGHRLYGQKAVERLQQILFFRNAGLPLGEIKRLLDEPGFDPLSALRRHLVALTAERGRLDSLIENAKKTLNAMEGEQKMEDKARFEGFKKERLEKNESAYGEEIRCRHGEAEVQAANKKWLGMSEEEYESMQKTEELLKDLLREGTAAEGQKREDLAREACAQHRAWLGYSWASYSPAAHLGLADMYEADERFVAYYEAIAPGATAFLCEAIRCYAQ